MANTAISGLTASAADLAATDILPVVQTTGVGPVKMTGQQLAGGLLGSTTLSGATVTADAPVLDLEQTWNNSGVTFTGLKFNAAGSSDANSGASSLLMDLQVGGSSKFNIGKDGAIAGPSGLITTYQVQSTTNGRVSGTSRILLDPNANGGLVLSSIGGVIWTNSTTSGTKDLILRRRDAANLALGAADSATPVAQTLSVQGGSGTNIAGANFTIAGSQGTGTGAGGSIVFKVAPAGVISGIGVNALEDALTIASDRVATFSRGVIIDASSNISGAIIATINNFTAQNGIGLRLSADTFARISLGLDSGVPFLGFGLGSGGRDVFLYRDDANTLALRNGANAQTFNVYETFTNASNFSRLRTVFSSNKWIIEAGSAGSGNNRDIQLQNNQASQRIILAGNTIFSPDNTYDIGAQLATRPRNVYVGTSIDLASGFVLSSYNNANLLATRSSTPRFMIGQDAIVTSATAFIGFSANGTDIGSGGSAADARLVREASAVIGVRGANSSTGGALSFIEQTAPAAPAADGVRIYAVDNGSGKTQLMALFATGAAQQIAIEP